MTEMTTTFSYQNVLASINSFGKFQELSQQFVKMPRLLEVLHRRAQAHLAKHAATSTNGISIDTDRKIACITQGPENFEVAHYNFAFVCNMQPDLLFNERQGISKFCRKVSRLLNEQGQKVTPEELFKTIQGMYTQLLVTPQATSIVQDGLAIYKVAESFVLLHNKSIYDTERLAYFQ